MINSIKMLTEYFKSSSFIYDDNMMQILKEFVGSKCGADILRKDSGNIGTCKSSYSTESFVFQRKQEEGGKEGEFSQGEFSQGEFSLEEKLLFECIEAVFTAVSTCISHSESKLTEKNISAARHILDCLTDKELDALIHVFRELNYKGGSLNCSKVSREYGITNSILTNTLQKVQAAGIIEVHSQGFKGTYIEISNSEILAEIKKY